eukprot:13699800-Alexandrium_andersonii.AAC.1
MEHDEFNTCRRLAPEARPDDGLVFKFIDPKQHATLPEWQWDWLLRFAESPLSCARLGVTIAPFPSRSRPAC